MSSKIKEPWRPISWNYFFDQRKIQLAHWIMWLASRGANFGLHTLRNLMQAQGMKPTSFSMLVRSSEPNDRFWPSKAWLRITTNEADQRPLLPTDGIKVIRGLLLPLPNAREDQLRLGRFGIGLYCINFLQGRVGGLFDLEIWTWCVWRYWHQDPRLVYTAFTFHSLSYNEPWKLFAFRCQRHFPARWQPADEARVFDIYKKIHLSQRIQEHWFKWWREWWSID